MLVRTLLALAIAWSASSARAQEARVVLASDDPELLGALEAALAPWRVAVVASGEEPGATMPGSAERGRALAEGATAEAAVWISQSGSGAALWMYDRVRDRVISRALPSGPPFDEPTAAAVALSIKTLLRHSDAAPIAERIVAPPPPAPSTPAPVQTAASSAVRVEIASGARALATAPADVEARFGVALHAFLADAPWLGLSIAARGGTGVAIGGGELEGRASAIDLHAGARARLALDRAIDLGVAIELGATLAIVEGHVAPSGRSIEHVEVDPTALVHAELGLRPLPALRVALRAGALLGPRTRAYLVRGRDVLATQPVALDVALVMELPLDGGRVDSR